MSSHFVGQGDFGGHTRQGDGLELTLRRSGLASDLSESAFDSIALSPSPVEADWSAMAEDDFEELSKPEDGSLSCVICGTTYPLAEMDKTRELRVEEEEAQSVRICRESCVTEKSYISAEISEAAREGGARFAKLVHLLARHAKNSADATTRSAMTKWDDSSERRQEMATEAGYAVDRSLRFAASMLSKGLGRAKTTTDNFLNRQDGGRGVHEADTIPDLEPIQALEEIDKRPGA